MEISKDTDLERRNLALLEAVRCIKEKLEQGEQSETEMEEESQSNVVPIKVGNLNFQIEAEKLEAIFNRSKNNEGSVEELLADHFVRNVSEIIEGRIEEMRREAEQNPSKLEEAFREKLKAKVKSEGETQMKNKEVSFAPENEPEDKSGKNKEKEKEAHKKVEIKEELPTNVASVSGTKVEEVPHSVKFGATEVCKQPICENVKPKNESKGLGRPVDRNQGSNGAGNKFNQ